MLTYLIGTFSATTEMLYMRASLLFFKIYLYHDDFQKQLNEPLQLSELYDKTSLQQEGYPEDDNTPLHVLYLLAEYNEFLII